MKYDFTFMIPGQTGIRPLEQSVTISKRGIHMGRALIRAMGKEPPIYIRIGIDEKAKAFCLQPTTSPDGAYKVGHEFGGVSIANMLLDLIGPCPYVFVENGVVICTAEKPTDSHDEPVVETKVKRTYKPREKKPLPLKKRGRPAKQKLPEIIAQPVDAVSPPKISATASEATPSAPAQPVKDMCENCDYHRPIKGSSGRVYCDKKHQEKNVDDYCFHYEPGIK